VSAAATVRLDKFLWAARFFKTRSLAAEAIAGGKVSVNGERAKPSKNVREGDRLSVRRPPFESIVVVRALSERRGPAAEAQALYEETQESRAKRAALLAEMKSLPEPAFRGRPTKKSRREYDKWLHSRDED
jgi:ribosome-associated heat shock protein Hsp15